MKPKLFSVICLLLIIQIGKAQPVLIERNRQLNKNKTNISFKKFRLKNGLTIILTEDYSVKNVVVNVTYNVGSANDPAGKSGLAHFFEHLMFKGSMHVADGDHIRLVSESGGTTRGQTFPDRTAFTDIAPSNAIQRLLWLEADRMRFWIQAFDTTKLATQKKIIISERMQNVENIPAEQLQEITDLNFFANGHPYHHAAIGYIKDIQNITYDDICDFYLSYYMPNNAILAIAGNFNEVFVLKWIQ